MHNQSFIPYQRLELKNMGTEKISLLVAIKRIQSLESFDPSSREWPSDAYLQFGFYLMSTG